MLHLLLAGPRRPAQKKKRKKRVEVRNIMHGNILTLKKCTSTSVKLKNDFFGGNKWCRYSDSFVFI